MILLAYTSVTEWETSSKRKAGEWEDNVVGDVMVDYGGHAPWSQTAHMGSTSPTNSFLHQRANTASV